MGEHPIQDDSDRTGATPSGRRRASDRRSLGLLIGAVGVLIAAIAVTGYLVTRSSGDLVSEAGDDERFEYDYLIPAGTQQRIDAGETVEIVPASLTVRVGESIRIVNSDDVDHIVGGFFVPAGTTLRQHFNSPGELIGECDVHPSGEFRLVIIS